MKLGDIIHIPLIVLFAVGGVALAYLERRSGRWLEAEARARMKNNSHV